MICRSESHLLPMKTVSRGASLRRSMSQPSRRAVMAAKKAKKKATKKGKKKGKK